MSDKTFKVGEEISVVYQAPGSATGKIVNMEIYDETGVKDLVGFPDVMLAEVGATGKYRGSFTPDAEGNWEIHVALSTGAGKIVKQYSVGGYNLAGIGNLVSEVKDMVDGIDSPAMLG